MRTYVWFGSFYIAAMALYAQPVNTLGSSTLVVTYQKTALIELGPQLSISSSIVSNPSVEGGFGNQMGTLAMSPTSYFHWTLLGDPFPNAQIKVSMQAPNMPDYFLITLVTEPSTMFGQTTPVNIQSPLVLTNYPQTWVSNLRAFATGYSLLDGLQYHYEITRNPTGSYASLWGGMQTAVITFTVVE
jgi:hypothetical protein